MDQIQFSVDAALLRELGERLVGKPHVALAELVKNSYDADGNLVVISFEKDQIEVSDNGNGMAFPDFKNFWMRIGSPHKEEQRVSKNLKRPMTGSKGVGRLAVQFLARRLELITVSTEREDVELVAQVNWDEAVKAGELTQAVAFYEERSRITDFPRDSRHGTVIRLSGLKSEWNTQDIVELAKEIWWLRPPFRTNPDLTSDAQRAFDVDLKSPDDEAVNSFRRQMTAFLDIWYAKLVGKLEVNAADEKSHGSSINLALEFVGDTNTITTYSLPDCRLHAAEFEIRVYHLEHRQPQGIKVAEARTYFNRYGGVHIYDSGFHLPYYGPETDWLRIEMDHSHRLSRSQLLPEHLQVPEGMTYLPTNSRLFGVVHVNTARERVLGEEHQHDGGYLAIQVTRDRLVDNRAFDDLRKIVRWALDFYAVQEARRSFVRAEAERPIEPVQEKFRRVDDVLRRHREDMPAPVYSSLREQVRDAIRASENEAELLVRQIGLLGPLATAGMSALGYEHEVARQLGALEEIARRLRGPLSTTGPNLRDVADELSEWVRRARAARALFSFLLEEENRERRARFRARELIGDVAVRMEVLLRGVAVDTSGIEESLRLPPATYAEWSAIFQNVFSNAINAMLDSRRRLISVRSAKHGRRRAILVQDIGVGVDLTSADELFKPFVRRVRVSAERRALGLGGSGLGLTIVRMVAENLGCQVSFIKPEGSFKTALELAWSEAT